MIKPIYFVLIFLSFFSCSPTQLSVETDKQRIDKVCDDILKLFAEDKIEASFELLKKNTVIPSSSVDTLQKQVLEQKETVFPQFGKMVSAEFVKENKVKDFLSKRFYIIRFTRFFLKVDITIYKTADGWKITSFHYKDDAPELLD